MRALLYPVFFFLMINVCDGSSVNHLAPTHEKAILKTDSSVVNVRHFDKDALKAYSRQPEFRYKQTQEDFSWWTRFWRWFWKWTSHLFSFDSKTATVWGFFWQIMEIAILLLGAAALVFFIFKSQGINIINLFRRKPATATIPYSEFFEDINQINFDQEIENAITKHNYRFAVRLLYLKCLKQLSDAGLIQWRIDKTNSTYIDELANNEQRAAFSMLTRQFEYIWYGEFLIDGQVYKNIHSSFQNFNKHAG
ncbi:MAG: hypothetical protein JWP78_934 [Mucilaginibacter sp.]|nr:hypothetical protein [Mucilaginibacter sp.]